MYSELVLHTKMAMTGQKVLLFLILQILFTFCFAMMLWLFFPMGSHFFDVRFCL
jgi:hypothetical protein